jgi:hypothetical protein
MRAIEYAKMYEDAGKTDEALFKVFSGILAETVDNISGSRCNNEFIVFTVLRDAENKWKAFANLFGLNLDGFRRALKLHDPEFVEKLEKLGW